MADYRIDQLPAAPGAPNATDIIEGERAPDSSPSSEKLTWDQAAQGSAFSSRYLEAAAVGTAVQPYSSILANTTATFTSAKDTKLAGVETGATADQTAAEIETAYNSQVAIASQAEAETGTVTSVRRWTPERIAQAIAAQAGSVGGGGGTNVTFGTAAPSATPVAIGDIYVDTDDFLLYFAVGTTDSGDWVLLANASDHPAISIGLTVPATTPSKVGDIYVDTTNDVAYVAVGTASSGDWASTAPGTVLVPHYDVITLPANFTTGAGGIASAWNAPATGTLVKARIWCDTAPANGVITVDLHKNGTTVFTTQANRPSIAIGQTVDDSGTPNVTSMAVGDRFQFQVDAINGSDIGNVGQLMCMIHWTQAVSL